MSHQLAARPRLPAPAEAHRGHSLGWGGCRAGATWGPVSQVLSLRELGLIKRAPPAGYLSAPTRPGMPHVISPLREDPWVPLPARPWASPLTLPARPQARHWEDREPCLEVAELPNQGLSVPPVTWPSLGAVKNAGQGLGRVQGGGSSRSPTAPEIPMPLSPAPGLWTLAQGCPWALPAHTACRHWPGEKRRSDCTWREG